MKRSHLTDHSCILPPMLGQNGGNMTGFAALAGSGFLLGWSVAWPPGPINAEAARRCLAAGFWASFALILGACTGDGVWALVVALGVGVVFTGPLAQWVLGWLSLALLAWLAVSFARKAWAAWAGQGGDAAPQFDGSRASFALGFTLALTSPWNVTFWLAAIGRPGMAELGLPSLMVIVVSVMAGAATWGLVWSGAVMLLRDRVAGGRWAAVVMNGATALLMAWFFVGAALRIFA
jgi:threonine/homoserine/homoserine lactone efflux protein